MVITYISRERSTDMPNKHILARIGGTQKTLVGAHEAGATMSNASKGSEREIFIDSFLSKVLPPIYRFGTGDATDNKGQKSGQLDVVIEHPFAPSLPDLGTGAVRLYLAESIAAVVEVKSDVCSQWSEVLKTAEGLNQIHRDFQTSMAIGSPPSESVPLFAVGYNGWKTVESVDRKLRESENVTGILVIEPCFFVCRRQNGILTSTGQRALWAFIAELHSTVNSLQFAYTNPYSYVVDPEH